MTRCKSRCIILFQWRLSIEINNPAYLKNHVPPPPEHTFAIFLCSSPKTRITVSPSFLFPSRIQFQERKKDTYTSRLFSDFSKVSSVNRLILALVRFYIFPAFDPFILRFICFCRNSPYGSKFDTPRYTAFIADNAASMYLDGSRVFESEASVSS